MSTGVLDLMDLRHAFAEGSRMHVEHCEPPTDRAYPSELFNVQLSPSKAGKLGRMFCEFTIAGHRQALPRIRVVGDLEHRHEFG